MQMTVRERGTSQWLSFPIIMGLILFVAVFLLGYLSIEAERKILQKNASIRSRNIALMLNVLMADPSIGGDYRVLRNYTDQMGTDRDIYSIEAERKILQKNASIRSRNIALMLNVLMADPSIGGDDRILRNYTDQMGTDRDIYSIEIIKGSQLIVGYHGKHATGEEDVFMISHPLLTREKEGGVIKVGFSKRGIQERVSRIKRFTAMGLGAILCFIFGYLFFSRSRPYRGGY